MIIIENLTFAYDNSIVLDNFSCRINDGEIVCVSGPSGKGKSTLLRIICGLEKNYTGKIEITQGTKFAVTFQEDILFPWLTAQENVSCVSNSETAEKWLRLFDLGDSLNKYPNELSGGMSRRVALARAAAFMGDVLILDEGFSGLDDKLKEKVMIELKKNFSDKIIIFTSHDTREMDTFSTKIISL